MHRQKIWDPTKLLTADELEMELRAMSDDSFFGKGSPYLDHPLLTAERTTAEVDFIEKELDLGAGSQVLDVGCGIGRHSIELARRGCHVVGIDPSEAMIEAARSKTEAAGAAVDFYRARGEEFETPMRFDAAVCLFTSLGQVDDQGDNSELTQRVWKLIKPGGWFIVEVPQREAAVRQLRAADRFEGDDGYTAVNRQYNPATRIVTENFRVVLKDEMRQYRLQYRLFSSDELQRLLTNSGFNVERTFADYSGTPLTNESPMMIMIARRDA